jgi:hypothetical protein
VSTDAAVRIRVASSDRAPFDSRPVSTHEPGARPCFSGLRRTRPRARHPDFVSDSPALAIRSTSRVDEPSTESASTPTRLARVRSSFVTPPWLGDASETLAPVRSSSRSPSRVIVMVIAVRARSRVSESAVHAFGRRDRDALRPTSALRTIQLREPRASCAPGAEITRFDPRNLPRAEACASCSLFAAYIREPFSRRRLRSFESAYTGGLGARRCGARPGERAFHDARTAGRIDRARVGIVRPYTRIVESALDVSVASSACCRDHSSDRGEPRRPPRSIRRARS